MDVASAHVMVGAGADAHGVLDQARRCSCSSTRSRTPPSRWSPTTTPGAPSSTGDGPRVAAVAGAPARWAARSGRSEPERGRHRQPTPSPRVSVTSSRASPAENVLGTWELPRRGHVGEPAGDEQEDGGDEHQRHRRLRALAPDPAERRAARGRCRRASRRSRTSLVPNDAVRRVPEADHVHDLGEREQARAPPRRPCAMPACATARTPATAISTAPTIHGHGDGGGTYTSCPRAVTASLPTRMGITQLSTTRRVSGIARDLRRVVAAHEVRAVVVPARGGAGRHPPPRPAWPSRRPTSAACR